MQIITVSSTIWTVVIINSQPNYALSGIVPQVPPGNAEPMQSEVFFLRTEIYKVPGGIAVSR